MFSIKTSHLLILLALVALFSVASTIWLIGGWNSIEPVSKSQDTGDVAQKTITDEKALLLRVGARNTSLSETELLDGRNAGTAKTKSMTENDMGPIDIPGDFVVYDEEMSPEEIAQSIAQLSTDEPVYSKKMTDEQLRTAERLLMESMEKNAEVSQ